MIGLLSVSYASAQDSVKYPSIVQKLADKFNLNEADVQAVFNEERQDHYADLQARWNEKLDDLVNSGKITESQKASILVKHEEMHNNMLELKDMTPEERRAKKQEMHDDLKKWAEEQGIDLPILNLNHFGMKKGLN